MDNIPIIKIPEKENLGFCWNHQFTIPLLFDDCLSLLQKVCALWAKLNDVIDASNKFNDKFNIWAKVVEDSLKDLYAKYETLDTWSTDYGIITIGDSYGEGYTPDGTVKPWCDILHERYFSDASFYVNKSRGGSGFGANTHFSELLSQAIATLTDEQKKQVKYVVVAGGWNDQFASISTVNDGIKDTVNLMSQLPNATLYIGWIATPIIGFTSVATLKTYNDIKTLYSTNWLKYKYLSGADSALRWVGVLSSDNIHPNATGQYSIADMIYKAMDGYATWDRSMPFDVRGSGCTLNTPHMKVELTNNTAHCSFLHVASFLELSFNPVKTFTNNSIKVMEHDLTFVNNQSICNCNAIVHNSTGYRQCMAVLTINPFDATQVDSGAIYLQLVDVTESDYTTFSNVDRIQLYGVEFNIAWN